MDANTIVESQTKKYVIIGIASIIGLGIVYFGIINPLLKWSGLKDDKTDKEAQRLFDVAKSSSYWKPTYFKGKESYLKLTATKASEIAKQIDNSFSILGDDESKVNAALSLIPTKVDLSYVVWQYQTQITSGKDLLSDLKEKLSSEEFISAISKVNKLS